MIGQNEALICICLFATAIGSFCCGVLFGSRNELKWRLRWIAHEHDLARLEQRTPQKIEDFEKQCDESEFIP